LFSVYGNAGLKYQNDNDTVLRNPFRIADSLALIYQEQDQDDLYRLFLNQAEWSVKHKDYSKAIELLLQAKCKVSPRC
jgi:hypothetical protein